MYREIEGIGEIEYCVDMEIRICSCTLGNDKAACKDQAIAANILLDAFALVIGNENTNNSVFYENVQTYH